jgi:hypothetical protein
LLALLPLGTTAAAVASVVAEAASGVVRTLFDGLIRLLRRRERRLRWRRGLCRPVGCAETLPESGFIVWYVAL